MATTYKIRISGAVANERDSHGNELAFVTAGLAQRYVNQMRSTQPEVARQVVTCTRFTGQP